MSITTAVSAIPHLTFATGLSRLRSVALPFGAGGLGATVVLRACMLEQSPALWSSAGFMASTLLLLGLFGCVMALGSRRAVSAE